MVTAPKAIAGHCETPCPLAGSTLCRVFYQPYAMCCVLYQPYAIWRELHLL